MTVTLWVSPIRYADEVLISSCVCKFLTYNKTKLAHVLGWCWKTTRQYRCRDCPRNVLFCLSPWMIFVFPKQSRLYYGTTAFVDPFRSSVNILLSTAVTIYCINSKFSDIINLFRLIQNIVNCVCSSSILRILTRLLVFAFWFADIIFKIDPYILL